MGDKAMSMAERDGVIWLDVELVPWLEATVHVLTHTLHYGRGVFEGVRGYETSRGPDTFKYAHAIVQCMGQHVHCCLTPRHQLSV